MKVIWSPLAEARAIEAVDYIARERPQAAAAWLEELLERTAALDRFPERGRIVVEIGLPAYRELLHAPFRVIYRVDPARVVILTLRHSRRAWDETELSGEQRVSLQRIIAQGHKAREARHPRTEQIFGSDTR